MALTNSPHRGSSHYVGIAALTLVAVLPPEAFAWSLPDGAEVHPPYRGIVPDKSDVIFSTRFKRPDAISTAKAFGATRVEWVYTVEKSFAAALKAEVPWFGGTINANGPLPSIDGTARDFDGNPLVPPWMKAWSATWVTTTHLQTQQVIAGQVNRYLAMGADSIQVDDPNFQYHGALFHGGDFNPATLEGFRAFLDTYPDQALLTSLGLDTFNGTYRDYLISRHQIKDAADYKRRYRRLPSTPVWQAYIKSTVAAHYARLRAQLNTAAGRKPVALSLNLSTLTAPDSSQPLFHLAAFADYAMPETRIKDVTDVYSMASTVRALRIGWAPSILPESLAENRMAIALMYALGGQPVVPWDVYNGNDESGMPKRYFGRDTEYGDLFGFVRSRRALFDGFETAAMVAVVVPVDKFKAAETKSLLGTLIERHIPFAFVPVFADGSENAAIASRLGKFNTIMTVNPDVDFDAGALQAMAKSGVERLSASALTTARLDAWRPFVIAPSNDRLHLIPRAIPGDRKRLVVHVIDERQAEPETSDGSCQRRIGIRRHALKPDQIVAAHWISGKAQVALNAERSGDAVYFTLEGCALWGVVDLTLSP